MRDFMPSNFSLFTVVVFIFAFPVWLLFVIINGIAKEREQKKYWAWRQQRQSYLNEQEARARQQHYYQMCMIRDAQNRAYQEWLKGDRTDAPPFRAYA